MIRLPHLALVLSLLIGLATAAPGATYYVSPQGADTHDGLSAAPARALRTVQAGVNKLQPGDTLLLRAGTYRETVVFPRSGESGRPITVRPYRQEQVTISGCDPVGGWTRYRGRIWRAPMPWTLGTGRNQVFAGGKVLIEARYPNKPDPGLGMYVSGLSPLWPTFGEFSIPAETKTQQPGRIVSKLLEGQPDDYWKGALYYGVHYEGWAGQSGVVESSRSGEINVGDRTSGWWFGSAYGGTYSPEEGRGMLVGHLNALDQPGEWHWQEGMLYLIPQGEAGQPPAAVEAKHRQLAFDLSGREYLRLEDLNVHGASMRLQDSAFCTVERCRLRYISHFTRQYTIGEVEHGKGTIKSGETGIYLGGHDNSFLSCSVQVSAGAGFHLRGYHQTIHNCLIDEVCYTAHYYNAITDAVSDFSDYENFLVGGHVITYNTMRNAGRHFFNFYGNGTSLASRTRSGMDYMATLFAHNHLYNGMLQTKDAGFLTGYYCTAGSLDGLNSQVAYNVMHDCYDTFAMRINALGIVYLDAGTCDADLYNNLLWAAPGSLQRGLWYNTMCVDVHERDNVFHPQFTRTSAELKPSDFPGGKPFRFGHDFANVPPLPQWPQLEKTPLTLPPAAAQLQDGVSLDLGEVDFRRGWRSAVMSFASTVKALNADRSTRSAPRHRQATDPLVLEVSNNDGLQEKIRRQWTFMHSVGDGAWVRFNGVPLGEGYRRLRLVYGNDQAAPSKAEVRLDALDGPVVATAELPQTDRARGGRVQVYGEATAPVLSAATGTHDLFFVFRCPGSKTAGEFEYFRFEQYRGELPLHKEEGKFELRLDSATGEKIGELYPRFTGEGGVIKPMVTTLEPVTGTHRLFLRVRSALPGAIGNLSGLTLERARQPIDWRGVGEPPLLRAGKPVYPAATNRPCARPADRYAQARAADGSVRDRAVAVALPLSAPPRLDGRLDDWPAAPKPGPLTAALPSPWLTLAESYDATPSAAPASRALFAYDNEALYLAVKNPVGNASSLLPCSHKWGEVDGVELAFQDAFAASPGPILTLYGYPDGNFTSEDYGGATAAQIDRLHKIVTYRAAVGTAEWTCEWRVPFSACGFTPTTAPLLLANLGVRKTAPAAWVIWRGTGGATYQVAQAGLLAFANELRQSKLPAEALELHLDAAASEAVKADAEGRVSTWADSSGRGRDAVQPQAQFRPRLVPQAMNGLPVLRFDEKAATRLEVPDLAPGKITATVIAVVSNPVAGAEVNHDPRLLTSSDGKGFDYQVGICCAIRGMETGGPRVIVTAAGNASAKAVHIGCFSPNYQTFFTGDLAELLVYSRALKPAELERVRAYLTAKWGL